MGDGILRAHSPVERLAHPGKDEHVVVHTVLAARFPDIRGAPGAESLKRRPARRMLGLQVEAIASGRPLVGRDRELDQLEASLDALGHGSAGCLALEGEAGIGKTRLLRELAARAEQRGHLVLAGSAVEFEREVPFSVWVDALNAYVASQDLPRHAALDDGLVAELGAVLPALRRPDALAGHAVADERYRAHRAVSTLLSALSENQALVLILDDLHWADGASVELIASLLRRWTKASVLLALGFRPGQAPARLSAALGASVVSRMVLEPLSEAQAGELLAGVEPASVAAMYRQGGGNPFYLEQLARGLSGEPGGRGVPECAEGVVPAAVAASLADELAALSATARRLLDAAAVAGEPFEPDLAAAIAELAAADALVVLDELLCGRPRTTDERPEAVQLPSSARASRGLRGDARRLAPRSARTGRRRARGARRWTRRARPSHRAGGRTR